MDVYAFSKIPLIWVEIRMEQDIHFLEKSMRSGSEVLGNFGGAKLDDGTF